MTNSSFLQYTLLAISFGCLFLITSASAQLRNLDIHLENYEYPYPVAVLKVNAQNQTLNMAYMDVKPSRPNGKTVLLLHGKNFNGAYWRQTADTLLSLGYRVLMPDQIGFGKSSKPEHFQYSFQQLATLTKKLVDTLGIKNVNVLGHSMGGMLAVRFTLMYPEIVSRLILENPIGLEDYKVKVPYTDVNSLYQKELKQDHASLKKYQLTSYYDNQWKPEYDEWLNLLAGWTLNKDYPRIAWNNALTTDMIMTQPVVYEFGNINRPVLLIIGQRDRTALGKDLVSKEMAATMGNYPALSKKTKAKMKNSRLVKLEGIGHMPHIESFDRFITPLLDFLKK